jgi:hypothetical protein
VFVLPGGYVDAAGAVHREVELRPLTGCEEEYLSSLAADTSAGRAVTQLLARCLRRVEGTAGVDAAIVRGMLVGDREYLMVKLRQMTSGDKMRAILRCPSEACGKNMEVPISLAELPVEERPVKSGTFTVELTGHGPVEFRLPTGGDQEALAPVADEPRGVDELLRRCVLRMPGSATLADAGPLVEERIEQLAPRMEVELEAVCPECGNAFSAPLDLAGFVLSELMSDLQHLRPEVHFLAWHYHWPESEILAMTRRKRRRYIELVEDELERLNPS